MEAQMMSSSMGAMGSLLWKLRSLMVSPKHQLPRQLKPLQIELLKQDLEEINTLLADLSRAEAPNTMAKQWMNEVRDLSYDIEDYIDRMNSYSDTTEEIPSEIDAEKFSTLVKQASDTLKRHARYKLGRWTLNPSSSSLVNRQDLVPTLSGEARDPVGIGDSKDKLIEWLTNPDEHQLKVASILGSVGVGKTTLAKQVYREIGGQFECRAFVRASRMPDTRRLLRSMISQIQRRRRPPYAYTVQDLLDELRGHLQHKRYFIVVDGLWETTSWDIVNSAFPEGTHCSRIVITTDIGEVALECCDHQADAIFNIEPLSANYSTELFFNEVFNSKYEFSEQLKEVAEEVIRNCCGLPLAITSIASILARQLDNSKLWYHVKECLSSSMKNSFTSEDILREIVCLCYNNLSHHLKTCLLYLSMYPEGYTFLKTDLVKQWTAEGFISTTAENGAKKAAETLSKYEIAECYFNELVRRGFIQPNHIRFSDDVMFYTVHSTVFEVIKSKSIEENFTTMIDYSATSTGLHAKIRRLALYFSNAKYAMKPEGITLPLVRSLNFYGLVECLPSVMKFEVLRVLILEFWGDQEEIDLSGINKLFQLRYVRITTDITVKLPTKMRGLRYLETLEIYARVAKILSDIIHLPSLLHLHLYGEINLTDGIAHMRSLRTLQCFDLSNNSEENVRSLCMMTNLRDLHLTCSTAQSDHLERNLIALASSVENHCSLKSLSLAPAGSSCTTSIYVDCSSCVSSPPILLERLELLPPICIFSRLPKWIGRLRNLCILKIVVRELTRYDVNRIAELQKLTVLSLYVRQPTAESIVVNCKAFRVLKCFKFRSGILRLAFQAEAMPNLRRLKLEFNAHSGEDFGNMLAGIERLINLQEIAGRVGAAPGAQESDRMAAESMLWGAISKHSRILSLDVRRVDSVDEEYGPSSPQYSFKSSYREISMDYLNLLINGQAFSDVTFNVEGRLVHAHRCVLAARSLFFRRFFSDAAAHQVVPGARLLLGHLSPPYPSGASASASSPRGAGAVIPVSSVSYERAMFGF